MFLLAVCYLQFLKTKYFALFCARQNVLFSKQVSFYDDGDDDNYRLLKAKNEERNLNLLLHSIMREVIFLCLHSVALWPREKESEKERTLMNEI